MRTASGARPRMRGDVVAVHVGRLRAGVRSRAVADAARAAGLGLDIGVLDEAGLEVALDDGIGSPASAASASPRATRPRTRMLPGRLAWMQRRVVGQRRVRSRAAAAVRSRRPGNASSRAHRSPRASPTTAATASPRKRASSSAKTGWSAKAGMTPKMLRPGMSAAVRTRGDAGIGGREGGEIAEARSAARDTASGSPSHSSASGGNASAPKSFGAVDLSPAVEPRRCARRRRGRPAADRADDRRGRRASRDGVDDLAVAGAAAEHAAERVLDLASRRARHCASSSAVAATSMPGVQMPHCAAPWRGRTPAGARRRGCAAAGPRRSTTARARRPAPAGTRQAQTGAPSSSTVQAPQSPASQPTLVPVRPSCRAGGLDSRVAGEAAIRLGAPLRVNATMLPACACHGDSNSRAGRPRSRCHPWAASRARRDAASARRRYDRRRWRAHRRWARGREMVRRSASRRSVWHRA